jgi:hypothetical protein
MVPAAIRNLTSTGTLTKEDCADNPPAAKALRPDGTPKKCYLPDGNGLYLRCTPSQIASDGTYTWSKSFEYHYEIGGRSRCIALGAYPLISLKQARQLANQLRIERIRDPDPARTRQQAKMATTGSKAFEDGLEEWLSTHKAQWRSDREAIDCENSLRTYVSPVVGRGRMLFAQITDDHAYKVLAPIWPTKTVLATRIRMRCFRLFEWAGAKKYRDKTIANPFRWEGGLKELLPPPGKIHRKKHHAMLPYKDAPALFAKLQTLQGTGYRALEMVLLTAGRTKEIRFMAGAETDTDEAIWELEDARMKGDVAHRRPLNAPAMAVLRQQTEGGRKGHVFPAMRSSSKTGALSRSTPLRCLKKLHPGATVHGIRRGFKKWCDDESGAPDVVSEAALAHLVGNEASRAYRGDYYKSRIQLMTNWAIFLKTGKTPHWKQVSGEDVR